MKLFKDDKDQRSYEKKSQEISFWETNKIYMNYLEGHCKKSQKKKTFYHMNENSKSCEIINFFKNIKKSWEIFKNHFINMQVLKTVGKL